MSSSAPQSRRSFAWKELYTAALLELDTNKLPERVAEAEKSIMARAQELLRADGDNIEELEALEDGLYAMRALASCNRADNGIPPQSGSTHKK
jgi:hypothetical protein